jgi:thioredoxin reductase (NADPH)
MHRSNPAQERPPSRALDLLVVGAGPTGLAIGAAARVAGDLDVLVVDRGPLTAALLEFPTYMRFFTTRERLEIGGVPFAVPEAKPDRRQALVYYRAVVDHHRIPLALHEEVVAIEKESHRFRVVSVRAGRETTRLARQVAIATGYFHNQRRLGASGEERPWVHHRYREPYGHFGQHVVVIGGGNSAAEAALDLWRAGARVTIVHRGERLKATIKYWLRPDIENRIAEGSIRGLFNSRVVTFGESVVELETPNGPQSLAVDAAYVLIGYEPDVALLARSGVVVAPDNLEPQVDPETCESNVPGLYVAGTLLAGRDTGRIFIESSRDHGDKIIAHLLRGRGQGGWRGHGSESLDTPARQPVAAADLATRED